MMTAHTPGICRYCRCTESTPCTMPDGDGCAWADRSRTVCTASSCMRQHAADTKRRAAAMHEATRRRTPAEIHALKMQEKQARGRRYRATAKMKAGRR